MTQVALITGAGARRVGWHVAQEFAARRMALAIHYRTSAREAEATIAALRQEGIDAMAFQADLTDGQQVRAMTEGVLGRFGRIDALVHCAASWRRIRLEEVTSEDVRRDFDTNTLSTFLCCQQAGLAMVRQPEGGAIVTIGDWATERPYLHHAAYFTSKGGIPTLTRTMAVELGTRNPKVRVNCVLPGPVMLPADLSAAEREEAIQGTLVRREGSPRNVAQAVLHFVDNDYITGACLPVDGGRTIYAASPDEGA